MAATGDQAVARLQPEHAAERGGNPDRAADVGAALERDHARGDRGRCAARRAARAARGVVRVDGAAVDRVRALPVSERRRNVGLAENDGAGSLQTGDDDRIFPGPEFTQMRQSPSRRQAGDVERLLDRHRYAEQRQAHALGELLVAIGRLLASAPEVANDDGIDRAVEPLDAADRRVTGFASAELFGGDGCDENVRRGSVEIGCRAIGHERSSRDRRR